MSKEWAYSQMTKDASLNGGPEKYIEKIATYYYDKGLDEGLKQGIKKGFEECSKAKNPVIAAVGIGAGIIVGGVTYYVVKKKTKKNEENKYKVSKAEAEEAQDELLREYGELEEENLRLIQELARLSDEADNEKVFGKDGD